MTELGFRELVTGRLGRPRCAVVARPRCWSCWPRSRWSRRGPGSRSWSAGSSRSSRPCWPPALALLTFALAAVDTGPGLGLPRGRPAGGVPGRRRPRGPRPGRPRPAAAPVGAVRSRSWSPRWRWWCRRPAWCGSCSAATASCRTTPTTASRRTWSRARCWAPSTASSSSAATSTTASPTPCCATTASPSARTRSPALSAEDRVARRRGVGTGVRARPRGGRRARRRGHPVRRAARRPPTATSPPVSTPTDGLGQASAEDRSTRAWQVGPEQNPDALDGPRSWLRIGLLVLQGLGDRGGRGALRAHLEPEEVVMTEPGRRASAHAGVPASTRPR